MCAHSATCPDRPRLLMTGVIALVMTGVLSGAGATELVLTPVPPYLLGGVPPNLIITIDDSGSMNSSSAFIRDTGTRSRALASPEFNALYYNPLNTYTPGYEPIPGDPGHGFTQLPDADFNSADRIQYKDDRWSVYVDNDPVSRTVNLSTDYKIAKQLICNPSPPSGVQYRCDELTITDAGASTTGARYWRYNGTAGSATCSTTLPPTTNTCFESVPIPDDQKQNFANWYQFYRTRDLAVKTVLSQAIAELPDAGQLRMTYQSTNNSQDLLPPDDSDRPDEDARQTLLSDCNAPRTAEAPDYEDGRSFACMRVRFAPLEDNRADFVNWLQRKLIATSGTYLQAAHIRAGEFVRNNLGQADDIAAYWNNVNPDLDTGGLRCRKNFHLMFTDGEWTDTWNMCSGANCPPTANQDGTIKTLPDGKTYDPSDAETKIFSDQNYGSLADVVFQYWSEDLRTDAANLVPTYNVSADNAGDFSDDDYWNPRSDPANWQHLAFFPVAMATVGNVAPLTGEIERPDGVYLKTLLSGNASTYDLCAAIPDDYACVSKTGFPGSFNWPTGTTADPSFLALNSAGKESYKTRLKVDDLFHGALNARGRYASANDPIALKQAFKSALEAVGAAVDVVSPGAVSASSSSWAFDTRFFTVDVNMRMWTSDINAFTVKEDLTLEFNGSFVQDTPVPGLRKIYTLAAPDDKGSRARIEFTYANLGELSTAQQQGLTGYIPDTNGASYDCNGTTLTNETDALLCAKDLIAWLRGDHSQEEGISGATRLFRARGGKRLGDVLFSNLEVAGAPDRIYGDDTRSVFSDYAGFTPSGGTVVYFGAGDGMLHGFNAESREELFAYMPTAIFPWLHELADTRYGTALLKRAFADGPITVADAKVGDQWKRVLVGSLGLGAQGLYALDVTDPTDPGVLWEFSDASFDDGGEHGRDLGYSLGKPAIVPIFDADDEHWKWVALVSNGYRNMGTGGVENSTGCDDSPVADTCTVSQTGNAVLYVLNLAKSSSKRILARQDTGVGASDDRSNGLAAVTAVDNNSDRIVDVAYAGDLFGNLWRFDLRNLSAKPRLLFTAIKDGVRQPITGGVAVKRHPSGIGNLVFFGTGKFLELNDKANTDVQTFYAIWDYPDKPGTVVSSDLVDPDLEPEDTEDQGTEGDPVRRGIDYAGTQRGWFIDLLPANGVPEGERVISTPEVLEGRVVFMSSKPPTDICGFGGFSRRRVRDANTGSAGAADQSGTQVDGIEKTSTIVVAQPGKLWSVERDRKTPGTKEGLKTEDFLDEANWRNWTQER